jgi:thiosulfate/3-mercaptopyruvate sulfurtransferase
MKKLILFLLFTLSLYSYDAFVSAETLKENLDNPKVVIIDVNSQAEYDKSHIKGALHVDIEKFKDDTKSLKEVLEGIWTRKRLQALGIAPDSHVIIYARSSKQDQLNASYFALVLIMSGFEDIYLLDGGYMTWTFKYDYLVSAETHKSEKDSTWQFLIRDDILVDTTYMQDAVNNIPIIDSRETSYYFGTKKLFESQSFGHIPSAKSSYYKDKFMDDLTLRSDEDLVAMLETGPELDKYKEVIVYGESVFDASMNWYLLYKKLGFKNVKIYENSFADWDKQGLATTKFKWE